MPSLPLCCRPISLFMFALSLCCLLWARCCSRAASYVRHSSEKSGRRQRESFFTFATKLQSDASKRQAGSATMPSFRTRAVVCRAPLLTCKACLAGAFNGIFHENAEAERLSLEFIQDRMATDDPIRGYFIRTNDEKQLLQGFIWYEGYLIRSSNLSSSCNASSGIHRAQAIFHMHKQE
jgi:hypothetical protein